MGLIKQIFGGSLSSRAKSMGPKEKEIIRRASQLNLVVTRSRKLIRVFNHQVECMGDAAPSECKVRLGIAKVLVDLLDRRLDQLSTVLASRSQGYLKLGARLLEEDLGLQGIGRAKGLGLPDRIISKDSIFPEECPEMLEALFMGFREDSPPRKHSSLRKVVPLHLVADGSRKSA